MGKPRMSWRPIINGLAVIHGIVMTAAFIVLAVILLAVLAGCEKTAAECRVLLNRVEVADQQARQGHDGAAERARHLERQFEQDGCAATLRGTR
jgi:hypothetical protein